MYRTSVVHIRVKLSFTCSGSAANQGCRYAHHNAIWLCYSCTDLGAHSACMLSVFSLHRLLPALAVSGTPGNACAMEDAALFTGVQTSSSIVARETGSPQEPQARCWTAVFEHYSSECQKCDPF
ncbi:hypothetical protein ABBQ32_002679 [Trebouxia sp. C0010 RCD-2024]